MMLRSHDADPLHIVEQTLAARPDLAGIPRAVWATAVAEKRYSVYIDRQRIEIGRAADLERRQIPDGVDYDSFTHLRTEARHSLKRFRPATIGQASRLEGLTPADVTLLAVFVKRWRDAHGPPHTTPEPTL